MKIPSINISAKQWSFYLSYLIFSITSSFKILINTTPFYKLLMSIYNIPNQVSLNSSDIYEDFSALMKYLTSFTLLDFPLKYFRYSPEGKFHFEEVRILFLKMDLLFWLSFFVVIVLLCLHRKTLFDLFEGYVMFLKLSIFLLIALVIPISINFSWWFEKFHKLFFNNNDWLFDPLTDPIINILPEEVFSSYLAAIIFIFLIFLSLPLIITKKSPKRL